MFRSEHRTAFAAYIRRPPPLETTADATASALRRELRRWLDDNVTEHLAVDITLSAYEAIADHHMHYAQWNSTGPPDVVRDHPGGRAFPVGVERLFLLDGS